MYSLWRPQILTDVWFMFADPRIEAPAHQSIFELEEAFDLNGSTLDLKLNSIVLKSVNILMI